MKSQYELLQRILNGSKEFNFEGTVLTLRSYRTGEEIRLDLSLIDEETFEEIVIEPYEDEMDEE